MPINLLIEELDDLIKPKKSGGGVNHDTGRIKPHEKLLPFTSSKKTNVIKDSFPKVLGEFTRLISGISLTDSSDSPDLEYINEKPIVQRITEMVDCENEDVRFDLHRFVEAFLYGSKNQLKPIHPFIFNYYMLSEGKKGNEEKKVAQFTKDVLVGENNSLSNIFKERTGEDILTSLILKELRSLTNDETAKQQFISILPGIS